MKNQNKLTLAATALALGGAVMLATAQDSHPDAPPAGGGQRGPGLDRRPPMPLVVRALDVNKDGVVDADEIANASAALKTLDKNGDGKLAMEEFMGPRPQMRGGRPGDPGTRGPGNPPPDGNDLPPGPPPGDN